MHTSSKFGEGELLFCLRSHKNQCNAHTVWHIIYNYDTYTYIYVHMHVLVMAFELTTKLHYIVQMCQLTRALT